MTKEITLDRWNYSRNRVVLRSTTDRNDFSSAFSFMTCGPIAVNHLLNQYTLPARKLTKDEWSSRSFDQLHSRISSDYLANLPSHWHPQKIFEEIISSPHTDFVVNAKTGQGKTTFLLQSSLERVIPHPSNYILSFTYAKSLGSTQQQKFHWLRRKLVPDLGRCELYFGGDQATKRRLRNPGKKKKPFAMLTTTIQSYSGSFAHFSPLIPNTKAGYLNSAPEVWGNRRKNPQYQWYEKLRLPTVLLIDELDSLPTHFVPCLAHLTRVLKWHDPTIQVILSSGTLGNPEEVAKHFFTNSSTVKVLSGSGQRGKLEIKVYKEGQEDKVELLLQKSIQLIRKHIDHEIQRYNVDRSYRPPKVILFLNHKTKINIKKVTGRFYKHVTTVHGGMESSEVIKRLAAFEANPKSICLVATELIQAGIDLPDVKWGVFYGLPVHAEQQRKFMQLRDRINRNPEEEGRLDIILRERKKVEQSLLAAKNTQKRQEYILSEKPVPLHIPYYTPISLRYWIVMGVLNGFPDVLKYIEEDLTAMDCTWDYHRDLRDAVIDLVLSRAVRISFDGILLPASGTRAWIYKFIRMGTNPSYKVKKVDTVDNTETSIGHIDEVTMLRHHLEGQSFPLGDFNYLVKRIELAGKNRQGTIYVIPAPPEFQFMENKIIPSTHRSRLHACVKEQGLALMTVNISHQLKEIDARTKVLRHLEKYHSTLSHAAVFLKTDPEMDEEESNSLISQLHLELTESLFLDPVLFDTKRFYDEEMGDGILFLDKTGHGLARMVYDFFKDRSSLLSHGKSSKIHNRGLLGAECVSPKWLGRFQYKYAMNIVAIPDLHLDGSPFSIQGHLIDFREFCRVLVGQIVQASMIIFLGDTFDKSDTTDYLSALQQLHILFETLKEYNVLEKTVFIWGNHDYDPEIFVWEDPIKNYPEKALDISSSERVIFIHGDNTGLEKLNIGGDIPKEKMGSWRKKFEERIIDQIEVTERDVIVAGHAHRHFHNKKQKIMLIPSIKTFLRNQQSQNIGCVGLVGFHSEVRTNDWETKIDRMVIPQVLI